jgi:integrase
MMFEAYRSMTASAVDTLTAPKEDPERCLKAMMEAYLKAVKARPQTVRHYRQMVRKLIETFQGEEGGGDRPLPFYTKSRMQQHRDRLMAKETISTQTVEKAFAPLKAMWKWAADEHDELTDLVFPPVRLPRRETTIEESSWQDFTPQEIKLVWKLLSDEWGPDSKSRLSPSRRAAFLMVVRVMLWTGLRPAEVFRLTPDSVEDGNVLRIRETKTTSRRIPISKHLFDLPDFLKADGFADCRKSATIRGTFSDNFRDIVRPHIADDRKVAYSLKHCLVARLTPIADDHVIRSIIGHKDKTKLRHYRKPLGETEEGRAIMKKALDRITYW